MRACHEFFEAPPPLMKRRPAYILFFFSRFSDIFPQSLRQLTNTGPDQVTASWTMGLEVQTSQETLYRMKSRPMRQVLNYVTGPGPQCPPLSGFQPETKRS